MIVKLYLPWERIGKDYTRSQVASAKANGCKAGGYVWCYRSEDPRKTVMEAVALADECKLDSPVIWLDCETYEVGGKVVDPGPDVAWLGAACDELRQRGRQPAIYTGAWYWNAYLPKCKAFADALLWVAQYDHIETLESVKLFGGWARATGKQYSADGIDLDVFDPLVLD